MKKIMITCLASLFFYTGFAQNKKGSWMVGTNIGSTGYSTNHSTSSGSYSPGVENISDSKSFNLGIFPNAGYYTSDKFVIGASVGANYYTSKSDNKTTPASSTSTSKSHYLAFSFGPFARYYFGDNKKNGMPFTELTAGISFYPGYKTDYTSSGGTAYTTSYKNYSPLYAGIKVGYEHFINSNLGLQYYIGYQYSAYKYDYAVDYTSGGGSDYTSKYDTHGGSVTFGLGLVVHLSCDKKKAK